jgi:uncharacterized protein YjbI with pentapeptide repeats
MADQRQLSVLLQGAKAWNELKGKLATAADLKGADLEGKDLSCADLRGANLEGATLRNARIGPGALLWDANFLKADLYQADLSGADLQEVNFTEADLFEARLREANLQGADLSRANGGLRTEQLAGADLTSTKLPEQLTKLYDGLENVKGISEGARKLFLAVLAACLYCWLTIATTTDVNLITNRNSSPLPIIQTSIPIVGFYFVAPLLVLCVYFYFHFYLQKLWEELGSLPAFFPDGRPLHAKVDPWLLNDLVRSHLPKLNVNRPFLSYLQLWISVLLAWWIVPITMLFFWARYLTRHERIGTALHVIVFAVSSTAAICLYRLAVATLRGTERTPFSWKRGLTSRRGYQTLAFALAAVVVVGLVSFGALHGVRSSKPILGFKRLREESFPRTEGPRTWIPRLMAFGGYPPFADLTGVEVSQKKTPENEREGKDSGSTIGAQLSGANLRYASAELAFLPGTDLSRADLSGANLSSAALSGAFLTGADLTGAELWNADLSKANLQEADLTGADLSNTDLTGVHLNDAGLRNADLSQANLQEADLTGADLSNTDLSGTNLSYADFKLANNINPTALQNAKSWNRAFYNDETVKVLGLPSDHNAKLAEQRTKDKELQQKRAGGELPYDSSLTKQ